jgi:hypothetical protein
LGWYYDTGDNYRVVLETLSGGPGTATEEPLPAPRDSSSVAEGAGDATCLAPDSCIAVGSDVERNRSNGAVIETLAGGVWTPAAAPLPAGAIRKAGSDLVDVACSTSGACVAVGAVGGDALIETLPGGESAPAVSSADEAPFTIGTSGTFTVTATGTPAPLVTKEGRLPKGLKFKSGVSTATITGTPDASDRIGGYPITVEAKNGVLPTATQSLTVTVSS